MAHYMAINKSGKNLPILVGGPVLIRAIRLVPFIIVKLLSIAIRRTGLRSISETVLGGLFRASIMPRMQMEMIFSPPMLRQ